MLYGKFREPIGEILRELCRQTFLEGGRVSEANESRVEDLGVTPGMIEARTNDARSDSLVAVRQLS